MGIVGGISDDLRTALGVLDDPGTELWSAVTVAVNSLKDLWLTPIMTPRIRLMSEAVFEAITRRRGIRALQLLRRAISASFRLIPREAAGVEALLKEYERRYYSDPGIVTH